ncbi:MAG: riboflavin synthase [bacterium]
MFTGIIETLGSVISMEKTAEGARLTVEATFSSERAKIGDSIAVNGVCLTIVKLSQNTFSFDISLSTLKASNLGGLSFGQRVNLERALKFDQRLDGHLVTGHIDTTVPIVSIVREGSSFKFAITVPQEYYENIVPRGSIALDGISLTITELEREQCWITIIPHTRDNTNLKYKKEGDCLNLETDIIGKYIQRQVRAHADFKNRTAVSTLTIEKILQSGF